MLRPDFMPLRSVGALTVTYRPDLSDGRLAAQLLATRRFARCQVVVDNGSPNVDSVASALERAGWTEPDSVLLRLPENLGIGSALNRGVDIIRRRFATNWILTLDQDTTIPAGTTDLANSELQHVA